MVRQSNPVRLAISTTQQQPVQTVEAAYAHQLQRLQRLDLDQKPEICPISVLLVIDERVWAARNCRISKRTLDEDPNARVLQTAFALSTNCSNCRTMKGVNDLKGNNVSIIPTILHPDHYA